MSDKSTLVIQKPTGPAQQLILLFHGEGERPLSMSGFGDRLAAAFPNAMVIAVQAPDAASAHSDSAAGSTNGYQWYSTFDLDEGNHPIRVTQAMPMFLACIGHWQRAANLGPPDTALVGFSQGATMALEAAKLPVPPSGRVISVAGRFAVLPDFALHGVSIHMLHGKTDDSVHYTHTVQAGIRLRDLGGDVTAEVLPFIGHEIHVDLIDLAVHKLSTHIPQQIWDQATAANSPEP